MTAVLGCKLNDSAKVTLLALSQHMTDAGYVSIPRDVIADLLGKHPSRITEHIASGKRAGLLAKIPHTGFRGRTAEYVATLPSTGKVTATRAPLDGKGDGLAVSNNSHLSGPKGDRQTVTQYARVSYETRQRNGHDRNDGASPHSDAPKPGSDEEAPRYSPLAAVSPTTDERSRTA
jgi:hypothetical protein